MFRTVSKTIFSTSSVAPTADTALQQRAIHSKKCKQDWLEVSSMTRNLKKIFHQRANWIIPPPLQGQKENTTPPDHSPTTTKILLHCDNL